MSDRIGFTDLPTTRQQLLGMVVSGLSRLVDATHLRISGKVD
jgi:hypothetical protein